MSNTVALLETIGTNARLRYAKTSELLNEMTQAHASESLKNAISLEDRAQLLGDFQEQTPSYASDPLVPQTTQSFWRPTEASQTIQTFWRPTEASQTIQTFWRPNETV